MAFTKRCEFCPISHFPNFPFSIFWAKLVFYRAPTSTQNRNFEPLTTKLLMETVSKSVRYPSLFPYQLARHAEVSRRTMTKWIHAQRLQLEACGYSRKQRILPPSAVKYLCDYYCIIL